MNGHVAEDDRAAEKLNLPQSRDRSNEEGGAGFARHLRAEQIDAIRAMDETATGPSLASFYRHLKRGLDEGWIESVGEETGAKSPGRPSQRFRVTDSGLWAVRSEAARLRALAALALSDDVTASANVLDV